MNERFLNLEKNVERREGFDLTCVWAGFHIPADKTVADFEQAFRETFGIDVHFLEEIQTGPDLDGHGNPVPGTGGRIDSFFAVRSKDADEEFCHERLRTGIYWLFDVLEPMNYRSPIYPDRVYDYDRWDIRSQKLTV